VRSRPQRPPALCVLRSAKCGAIRRSRRRLTGGPRRGSALHCVTSSFDQLTAIVLARIIMHANEVAGLLPLYPSASGADRESRKSRRLDHRRQSIAQEISVRGARSNTQRQVALHWRACSSRAGRNHTRASPRRRLRNPRSDSSASSPNACFERTRPSTSHSRTTSPPRRCSLRVMRVTIAPRHSPMLARSSSPEADRTRQRSGEDARQAGVRCPRRRRPRLSRVCSVSMTSHGALLATER